MFAEALEKRDCELVFVFLSQMTSFPILRYHLPESEERPAP